MSTTTTTGLCEAINSATGEGCALDAGHTEPHSPLRPTGPAPEPPPEPAKSRLRRTDRAVAAGRRGSKANDVPIGTYPVPVPPPKACIYGCEGPAKLYPCGTRCQAHSPAAIRAAGAGDG